MRDLQQRTERETAGSGQDAAACDLEAPIASHSPRQEPVEEKRPFLLLSPIHLFACLAWTYALAYLIRRRGNV